MSKAVVPRRTLWEDRFSRPTVAALVQGCPRATSALVESVRERLIGLGLSESLAWRGLPWRWAMSYGPPRAESAYLVPRPAGPSLAIRVANERAKELEIRKLARSIREGLGTARLVAGVAWPEWELKAKSQCDELVGFLQTMLGDEVGAR